LLSEVLVKILILHLSDVHISTSDDLVLARAGRIVEAVRNLDYSLDGIAVVVSGDIAFSGTEDQYLLALELVETVCGELKAYLNQSFEIPCIIVPGNHDCDFSGATAVRDIVLNTLSSEPGKLTDPDVVQVCTGVQESFFQFLVAAGGPFLRQGSRLTYDYRVPIGDQTLLFRCYNTAVTSRIEEKPGTLLCPTAARETVAGAVLVVSVLHHPYNWFTPPNARVVRREIEQTSDIVLTGHEHEHTRRVQHVATGEVNEFIEGAVLQESSDAGTSAFNVIVVDTENSKQLFYHFLWRDDRYFPSVSHTEWEPLQLNRLRSKEPFELTEQMQEFLEDPGLTLTHRDKGRLRLSDVYVPPDLREISFKGEQLWLVRGDSLVDRIVDAGRVLITGPEESGKTALAKHLFVEFRRKGFVPLYVDCASLKLRSPDQAYQSLYRLAEDQYGRESLETYRQLDRQRRVLLLDDVEKLAMAKTVRRDLVQILQRFSGSVLLLAHDLTLHVEEIAHNSSVPVKRYRIQQFGHLLRNQLVEKWFLLGGPGNDEAQFLHALAQVENVLDTILGKNFVPAYPVFILSILQASETATPIDLRASTHGYFYEMFIRAALAAGEDRQSFDIKTAYLSFLAYRFLINKWRDASLEQIASLHEEYERLYHIRRPLAEVLDQLLDRQVLDKKGGQFSFKYRYIYYYFVASYLRDHITETACRSRISSLAERVYVEDNANILLFLVHLSRDPFIIDEMLRNSTRVYEDWQPAQLSDDVEFLRELVSPPLSPEYIEHDQQTARREMLERLDEHEAARPPESEPAEPALEPAAALVDPVMRLNVALKSQQILGQILKNFPGSLEGDTKIRIAQECYGLGLRALAAIFDLIKTHKAAIVDEIRNFLSRERPGLAPDDLVRRARQSLGAVAYLIAYGLIKRISNAVGSPDLTETYERLLSPDPSIALSLVDTSIRLDHFAGFPEAETAHLAERLETKLFAKSVLQHMVIQRFYLFPADYKLKQRVCAKLGIPYKPIQAMDPGRKLIAPPEHQ
jgi:Calcineurin-like phosphoesterase